MNRVHPGDVQPADVEALEQILLRVSWASQRRLARELEAFRLTVPQLMALRAVRRRASACTMSELADATYQLSATMTGIVDRLEERRLVERRRDPADRRALRISLTGAGERLLDEIDALNRARLRRILSTIPPQERQQMLRVMQVYLDTILAELSLDGYSPDAVPAASSRDV